MSESKLIVGTCLVCGGDVVKTVKGYSCVNAVGENPSCKFFINGVIANRKMHDDEIVSLLKEKSLIFDGFTTKEGKVFSSAISIKDDGAIDLSSRVMKCPRCNGDVYVGIKGFNCSNYNHPTAPCNFVIWRNIAGHDVTLQEAHQICEKGVTDNEVQLFGATGDIYSKRLGLSPEKDKVIKI